MCARASGGFFRWIKRKMASALVSAEAIWVWFWLELLAAAEDGETDEERRARRERRRAARKARREGATGMWVHGVG